MAEKKKAAPASEASPTPAVPFQPFIPPSHAGEWVLGPNGPTKVEPKPTEKE